MDRAPRAVGAARLSSPRWSASAIAMMAAAGGAQQAVAADHTEGEVTLELQGQFDFVDDGAIEIAPVPDALQRPLTTPGDGGDVAGTVTYQPHGSPWSFAFGVRYGQTSNRSHAFQYTYSKYALNVQAKHRREHIVVDFEVGKDVGVGLLGPGKTTIGAGIRYAHFSATTRGSFTSAKYGAYVIAAGSFSTRNENDAVGPRFFIRQSTVLPGGHGLSLDWGVGGGVLFGRQTVRTDVTLSTGSYNVLGGLNRGHDRATPMVDTFVQLNWKSPRSPLSIGVGYRLDEYFDVLDGGFGRSRQINDLEHGPFLALTYKVP